MSLIYQPPLPVTTTTSNPNHADRRNHYSPRPGIYIGDKNDAKNYPQLIQRNITFILNVTPPKEACYKTGVPNYFETQTPTRTSSSKLSSSAAATPSPSFQYLRIPIYDSAISMTQLYDSIPQICTFINQAILYHQSSILIHCQRGISRSVTVAILYMIRCLEMSYDDAIAMIQRRRPQAQPIPEFVTMLQQYEITCRGANTKVITSTTRTATPNNIGAATTHQNGSDAGIATQPANDNHIFNDSNNYSGKDGAVVTTLIKPTFGLNGNDKKRSMVGPQRPPPTFNTVTVDRDTKRHKPNVIVGPQRPPQLPTSNATVTARTTTTVADDNVDTKSEN